MTLVRTCCNCGIAMNAGYCIENGTQYYCSDDCLHLHISPDDYDALYDDGNGDSYWTEWDDDDAYIDALYSD